MDKKSSLLVVAVLLLLCFSVSGAPTTHYVGGSSGWSLSSNVAEWAIKSNTFHVGDTLVFIYSAEYDVQEVGQLSFETCDTTKPFQGYNDGFTPINLTEPGTRFFICGQLPYCDQGLKMQVDVV